MKTVVISAGIALLATALLGAENRTVVFGDDFKDAKAFARNWDFRAPTQPENGVLFLAKNHFAPVCRTSLAGKDKVTVEAEVAVMNDKGFGGVNIDGISFFIRGGNAVAVFKSPLKNYMDSKLKKIPDFATDKFFKIAVTRTKSGEDYEYLYLVDGREICTVKNQKIPATDKVSLSKSQTDIKVKNFRISEDAAK